jgi:hypothetical protein
MLRGRIGGLRQPSSVRTPPSLRPRAAPPLRERLLRFPQRHPLTITSISELDGAGGWKPISPGPLPAASTAKSSMPKRSSAWLNSLKAASSSLAGVMAPKTHSYTVGHEVGSPGARRLALWRILQTSRRFFCEALKQRSVDRVVALGQVLRLVLTVIAQSGCRR